MTKATSPKSPLSATHYIAIGKVIVQWAKLEGKMILALQHLLKIKKADAMVTFWHSGYYDKRDRLNGLFQLDEPGDKLRAEDLAPADNCAPQTGQLSLAQLLSQQPPPGSQYATPSMQPLNEPSDKGRLY
jgi:hypothetical protein